MFEPTDNIALRVEGLSRNADNYQVPEFKSDVTLDYLPDSSLHTTKKQKSLLKQRHNSNF